MGSNRLFGFNLKTERKKQKISQEELSKRIGVCRSTLSSYERGHIINIPFETVDSICKELNISYDVLFRKCC